MSSLNVGIVGFAHGHVNGYLAAWKEHPEFGVKAVAGWDHDADRLASLCANHNLTPCSSLNDLLSDPAIQGVVIAAESWPPTFPPQKDNASASTTHASN